MGAGGDCAGWEGTFSLLSSFLHQQVSVLESWSQTRKNKKDSGHNKVPQLSAAGRASCLNGRPRKRQLHPACGQVAHPPGTECGAMCRAQEAPGGSREQEPASWPELEPARLGICLALGHLASFQSWGFFFFIYLNITFYLNCQSSFFFFLFYF